MFLTVPQALDPSAPISARWRASKGPVRAVAVTADGRRIIPGGVVPYVLVDEVLS
jgi:hypothetical protein